MERIVHLPTRYWIILLLIVCTLLVYWSVKDHEFLLYDDNGYIVNNYYIQPGVTWENVVWALTSGYAANWHPLTWISHMFDYQFFKLDPTGHHLHNVLLHILTTIILFLVLRTMTGAEWLSAFVAFVFALHPLHVESVAWAAERKDTLSGLLWMLTMGTYASYAKSPSVKRYVLVLFLLALGLMAKPMLVTLPFVLLLLDYWPLNRLSFFSPWDAQRQSFMYLVLEKVPLIVLSIGSSIITYLVQHQAGAVSTLEVLPLSVRFSNAIVSYALYIEKTFWPTNLAIFYPHLGEELPLVSVVTSAVFLVALTGLLLAKARHYPYLIVGWLWYLGTLVPVLGLVQVGAQSMADRYIYLPMIGLTITVGWFAADVLKGWRLRKPVLGSAFLLLVTVFMLLSVKQVSYWNNGKTLFEHALDVTEKNWMAHYNLGMILAQQGNLQEARYHYERTIEFNSRFADAYYDLGNVFMRLGQTEQAVPYFEKALEKDPKLEKAHLDLGVALTTIGKPEEALEHFTAAYARNRFYGEPHHNVGLILAKQERLDEAIKYFRQALEVQPGDSVVRADMERVQELKKRKQQIPK